MRTGPTRWSGTNYTQDHLNDKILKAVSKLPAEGGRSFILKKKKSMLKAAMLLKLNRFSLFSRAWM